MAKKSWAAAYAASPLWAQAEEYASVMADPIARREQKAWAAEAHAKAVAAAKAAEVRGR